MLPFDLPPSPPPSNAAVVLAQAVSVNASTVTVGKCVVFSSSTSPDSAAYNFDPAGAATWSLRNLLRRPLPETPADGFPGTETSIVLQPKHGRLEARPYPNGSSFDYRSELNFTGKDKLAAVVKVPGHPSVEVIYFFTIESGGPTDEQIKKHCSTRTPRPWMIRDGRSNAIPG